MKTLIKKLFFYDSPAHGALFGAALFIFGSFTVINLLTVFQMPLFGVSLLLCSVFFIYALITGCRYGWLRRKELAFSRRWKWQIPATCCWLISTAEFLREKMAFCGSFGIWSNIFVAAVLAAGIFFAAKIIESAESCNWKIFFGKGMKIVLIIWICTFITVNLRSFLWNIGL